jgi:hypothetical protein
VRSRAAAALGTSRLTTRESATKIPAGLTMPLVDAYPGFPHAPSVNPTIGRGDSRDQLSRGVDHRGVPAQPPSPAAAGTNGSLLTVPSPCRIMLAAGTDSSTNAIGAARTDSTWRPRARHLRDVPFSRPETSASKMHLRDPRRVHHLRCRTRQVPAGFCRNPESARHSRPTATELSCVETFLNVSGLASLDVSCRCRAGRGYR